MREFLLFATSSVSFALIACLIVTIAWLVLRSAGPLTRGPPTTCWSS